MILVIGLQTRKSKNNNLGFTLIEVILVVVLFAIISGFAIPNLYTFSEAEIKAQTRKLGEMIRYSYNQAIMKNRVHQMRFNFEKNHFELLYLEEASSDSDSVKSDKKEDNDNEKFNAFDDEETANAFEKKDHTERKKINLKGKFIPDDVYADPIKLSKDVRFKGVYTYHDKGEVTDGDAFVLFFPNGEVERSRIYLIDTFDNEYTIKINKLSGTVKITDGYEPIEEQNGR